MCAAAPVVLLLLVVFAALTAVRLSAGRSPNAELLARLVRDCAGPPGKEKGAPPR